MDSNDTFDEPLRGVRSAELKHMARMWGAPSGALPKDVALALIRAGLADPRRVRAVLAELEPWGQTALAVIKLMGGEADAKALALAARAATAAAPPRTSHAWRESPADWLQPLADAGLLLSRNAYAPHCVADAYSFTQSTTVFADRRLLQPALRPAPAPMRLAPAATPAAPYARRPQSVLLDLMSVLQAVDDLGGLRLNQRGSFYAADLKKVGKRLGWGDELDLDGLPFPAPAKGIVSALAHSGLLTKRHELLVPAESLAQFSLRPPAEPVAAMLRGFLKAAEWWEWTPPDMTWSEYAAPHYVQARFALLGALLALPAAGGGFFSLPTLSQALLQRVGEWVSLRYRTPRPSLYGVSADEATLAEAKWRASIAEEWQDYEQPWLGHAFQTWLYWLGLVELGLEDGAVTAFRLTDLGKTVLLQQAPPTASAPDIAAASGRAWVVQPDFEVTVYLEHATPWQLALLEHWAERRKAQRHIVQYRLTRDSVYQGLEAGHAIDQLLDELRAGSGHELPQNVSTELRGWAALREQITLHRGDRLLEFASATDRQAALATGTLAGTPIGDRFLRLPAGADAAAELPIAVQQRFRYDQPLPACLNVSPRGALHLATPGADLLLHSEIGAWTETTADDGWQLTAASVRKAIFEGGQLDDLFALLERRVVGRLPAALALALRAWAGLTEDVELLRAVVLRCPQREVLDALLQDPDVKPCILARLGTTAALVDPAKLRDLRKSLAWAGVIINSNG